MQEESTIVTKVSEFVARLFRERLPEHLPYHTFDHTELVAETAQKIGRKMKLGEEGIEVVTVAAWLHDTGYTELYRGHEEVSVRIAREFLEQEDYPQEKIDLVAGCIQATKIPQTPKNLLEQVVADADLSGFGRKTFFEHSKLIQSEWESALGKTFSEEEWAQQNLELLTGHRFFTPYAQKAFSEQKDENIRILYKKLRKMKPRSEKEHEMQRFPLVNGIDFHGEMDTMGMLPHASKPMKQIVVANSKAQILLLVSTLLLVFAILCILMNFGHNPFMGIPILLLLGAASASIVCTVLALMPEKDVSGDRDEALHSLARKNRLLRAAYSIFIYGVCTSTIIFIIRYIILIVRYSDLPPK